LSFADKIVHVDKFAHVCNIANSRHVATIASALTELKISALRHKLRLRTCVRNRLTVTVTKPVSVYGDGDVTLTERRNGHRNPNPTTKGY